MNIAKLAVKNPVLVNILMVAVLALGIFSLSRLPREQFSEVPFFFVNIIVPYPGVSAEDVEQTVTVPIENEMQGLDSLSAVRSVTSEGLSTVTVEFDDGISNDRFDQLFQEVQTRFGRVELPEGTQKGLVDDFSSNDFLPVIEVVLSGDVPYETLSLEARGLRDQMLRVSDVSGVDLVGSRDRQIVVEVQQERLEALGLPVEQVTLAIGRRNVTVPGGSVDTPGREYLLRTVGEVSDVRELEEIIVRNTANGTIRLGDVARVAEQYDPAGVVARFNGNQAILLRVNKVPRGNSIGVIEEVKRIADEYRTGAPIGLDLSLFNDSTVQIRESLDVLVTNALLGFGLLVVILFVFIGLRNALMTALGIPITFALTFLVLEALGETLNSNTLFGLVLVLGLIVDHAIVIVENSYRQQQLGLSRHRAAVMGTKEVIIPVVAATATTVAAFLPLTILPGTIGKFLRVVPLTVSIALIASTFEASFFLPSHYADWPGGSKTPRRRLFEALQAGFRRFIGSIYRFRGLAVSGMVLIMIGVFALVPFIQQNLFEAEDFSLFYIELELPQGSPQSKTAEVVGAYEDRILPLLGEGEVVAVSASVGLSQGDNERLRRSNVAQIIVDLTEKDEGRTRSITEIMADVQAETVNIAGTENVVFRKATNGPPTDPPVSFRMFGDDYAQLVSAADMVRDRLATYPELFNIEDNLDPGTPELRIRVDPDRAAAYGLSSQAIGRFVRSSFDGIQASTVFRENQELDVIVRYANMATTSVDQIRQLKIPTTDGRYIPFSAVAGIDEGEALASIKRLDGKREVTVVSEAYTTENLDAINADIEALFETEIAEQYPGVALNVGGEFAELSNLLIEILRVFLIGVLLIYLILGTQFRSYSQPFLILLSVPFAFVGVVLYLVVSGTALSTTVIYAAVALAGVAVNDTIVLVSFINDRRKAGATIREAVVDGAATRLRPILLTTLTTIAGLLPTAIGIGGRSVIWSPMASTIIFGLIFSTLTALVVVPNLYGLLYDRKGSDQRRGLREEIDAELDEPEPVLVGGNGKGENQ
jgi:multidrug efflux pump subunit AcrB